MIGKKRASSDPEDPLIPVKDKKSPLPSAPQGQKERS